ncbi:MAG: transglutaminase family protein [Anaerolineae bacterium]|nr:transglutaminase family protein [Anaerolineae bacterium]
MYYTVRHITRFRYSVPISQSLMEVWMQPRTETNQRCLSFNLSVTPQAKPLSYRDYLGNTVHHFDIPGTHRYLNITAQSQVEVRPILDLPDRLPESAWDELDGSQYDLLLPSHFTHPSPMLHELAEDLNVTRRDDPLTLLKQLTTEMYRTFEYAPDSTHVHSQIDEALDDRRGVCQDFTHIMLALVRPLGIPCRYVSGYLPPRSGGRSTPGASHAWLEALLPGMGWVGFDPTNNLLANERHIRVAIGRDYLDVPPTRGVFKGSAETELHVSVRVTQADEPPLDDIPAPEGWVVAEDDSSHQDAAQEQQQQQQQ